LVANHPNQLYISQFLVADRGVYAIPKLACPTTTGSLLAI